MQIYGRFPCKIQLLYWFPVLLARLVGVYCRWMLMNLGKNLREVHLNVKMWVLLFMDGYADSAVNNWLVDEGYVEYG